MWNTSLVNDGCQISVADLLVSALKAVIVEADALRNAGLERPVIEPGAGNDEIIEQLAAFRQRVKEIERREAVIIAKIAQARTWAQNLKRMAPALRSEIDMFRLATAQCSNLQASWLPDPHNQFNGGKRPQNYVDRRYRPVKWADGRDGGVDYEICGKVAASGIVFACEAFLARIVPYYERDFRALSDSARGGQLAIEARPGINDEDFEGQSVLELQHEVALKITEEEPGLEILDSEDTAKGMETLVDLGVRAQETMRLARAVHARTIAEVELVEQDELITLSPLEDPSDIPSTPVITPTVGPAMRRLPMISLDLTEEIVIPLDADDFFAGVPGAELGCV